MTRPLPDLLRGPDAPPRGENVTSAQRIAWIREQCVLYTDTLATEQMLGAWPGNAGRLEALEAASALGIRCGASVDEQNTAVRLLWQNAERQAADLLQHLQRRIWPMAVARMPETAIIEAAQDVIERHRSFIPDELLMPLLKRIWIAANRRRGRANGFRAA